MTWSSKSQGGETLSFVDAVSTASQTLIPRLVLPGWAYKLPIKAYVITHLQLLSKFVTDILHVGFRT